MFRRSSRITTPANALFADLLLVLRLNIDGHATCLRVLLRIIPLFELTLGPSFESI
jgi:hypothetical protein